MYQLLIFVHVVGVMMSVGPFFILIPLVSKIKIANQDQLEAYLPIFHYAVQFSKHSGHIMVSTGIILMYLGHWSWLTSWILLTILVMVSSLFFIARAFSPTLKKLRESPENRSKLVNKLRRSVYLYIMIMLLMMWFMVLKPNVW
jgi:hypothetical protein